MRRHRVAYLPGDGIGPEVCDVARRCVEAAGTRFGFEVRWDEQLVGGAAIDAAGAGAAGRHARRVPRGRRGPARRGRRPALGRPLGSDAAGGRAPRPSIGARAVRQPAPGRGARRARCRLAAASRGPRRRRHPDPARADRRPLLRPPAGTRGARRGGVGGGHAPLHATRDRAHRRARLRAGCRPSRPPHQRRQGQRAGVEPALARGGGRDRASASIGHRRARAGRLDRLPDPDPADALRRDRHREHVRRHPVGRGGRHRRLARAARFGEPRHVA